MPKTDQADAAPTRRGRTSTATASPAEAASPAQIDSPGEGRLDAIAARAGEAAEGAVELAKGLPATVDEVAAGTTRVLGDAQRSLQAGSDSGLLAGASLSAGLALGLLVGRAPRLAVVLALVPAAAFGVTLVERRAESGRLESALVN